MRRVLIALLLGLGAGCATPCPEEPRLETPRATLETFRQAFACGEAVTTEYRCLSDDVKRRFGGLPAYTVGREIFRRENSGLVLLLKYSDLGKDADIRELPGGNEAVATLAVGDDRVQFLLVNEPEYVLHKKDGSEVRGFARAVSVRGGGTGRLSILLRDENLLEEDMEDLEERIEIKPRWVLSSLPELDAAVRAANTRP